MGVRQWEPPEEPPPPPEEPSLGAALALALGLLVLLISNGRPLGSTEVQNAGISAWLAAPVVRLVGLFVTLDETATALAGKWASSLLSSLAAGILFLTVARRRPGDEAAVTAFALALGTPLWAASQSLSPQPAAACFLSLAVLWMLRAEYEPAWAGRLGLPLGLALASHPGAVALVVVLALATAFRWPRKIPLLLLWALPGSAVLVHQALTADLFGDLGRVGGGLGAGHLGLLVSPAKGLLVFTPIAAVALAGLLAALRSGGDRWLAGTLGAGALAHWLFLGSCTGWHGGEGWGPRMMSEALPLLLVFLPEGLDLFGRFGTALLVLSVSTQALGAFSDGHRWEKLHQRLAVTAPAGLWDALESPIVFGVRERVVVLALPSVADGRAMIREHRLVLLSPAGSRVAFAGDGAVVKGRADATLGDVHLLEGARARSGRLELEGRGDGLFLRVLSGARARRLELRVSGRGRGMIAVGERTFWTQPRVKSYPVAGEFLIRHPYDYPSSGGPDVTIALEAGEAQLEAVTLVPPGTPENVIELRVGANSGEPPCRPSGIHFREGGSSMGARARVCGVQERRPRSG